LASASTLATSARAQYHSGLASLASSNSNLFTAVLAAASSAIKRETMRDFISTAYTEYYDGLHCPNQVLSLKQYPVLSISRVATDPRGVLSVTNSSASNQRATVSTTSGAVSLVHVASAVSSTNTLAFATYTTVSALETAIDAIGSGWAATALSGYGSYASADLTTLQGAMSAMNTNVELLMYLEDAECWRLDDQAGILHADYLPRGRRSVRVDYTSGYAAVPDEIQEACVQLAYDIYLAGTRDGGLTSVHVGPDGYTTAGASAQSLVRSPKIQALIGKYKAYDKLITD
jgi:hypothetical protein